MGNNYSNGIISKPNISAGNPYGVNRTFIARIANNEKFGTVQIPMLNQQQGLEMLSPDNLFQTSNATNIEENSYYIDYASQVIFFNPKQIGQKIVFAAYDMGEDLISDHKICTLVDNNGNPIETLKDIIDKGFEAIDYLNTIGSAIEITDLLKAEIENGKNMADNLQEKIVVGGNTITLLTNITNEAKDTNIILSSTNDNAKATDTTLKSTISNANVKDNELKASITSAESKRVEVVDVTANANSSKTQLQTVINDSVGKKTQLQTTIDDSVVKNNILQASIGSADIGGMKGDIVNLQATSLKKADLLTEVKKVDGVGSGLDADLLQGTPLSSLLLLANLTGSKVDSKIVMQFPMLWNGVKKTITLQIGSVNTRVSSFETKSVDFNEPFTQEVLFMQGFVGGVSGESPAQYSACATPDSTSRFKYTVISRLNDNIARDLQVTWIAIGI